MTIQQSLVKSHLLYAERYSTRVFKLMTQIHQNKPKLSIYGYVDISRQLIPTVSTN